MAIEREREGEEYVSDVNSSIAENYLNKQIDWMSSLHKRKVSIPNSSYFANTSRANTECVSSYLE